MGGNASTPMGFSSLFTCILVSRGVWVPTPTPPPASCILHLLQGVLGSHLFFFFFFWFLLSMQRRLKVLWLCSMALLCYKIRGESLTKPIQETKQHLLTSQKGGPNDAKRCIFCSKSGSWPGHSLTPLSCPLCPFCPTNWLQWLHFSPFMQTRRCQASSLGRLLFSKSRNV